MNTRRGESEGKLKTIDEEEDERILKGIDVNE